MSPCGSSISKPLPLDGSRMTTRIVIDNVLTLRNVIFEDMVNLEKRAIYFCRINVFWDQIYDNICSVLLIFFTFWIGWYLGTEVKRIFDINYDNLWSRWLIEFVFIFLIQGALILASRKSKINISICVSFSYWFYL